MSSLPKESQRSSGEGIVPLLQESFNQLHFFKKIVHQLVTYVRICLNLLSTLKLILLGLSMYLRGTYTIVLYPKQTRIAGIWTFSEQDNSLYGH